MIYIFVYIVTKFKRGKNWSKAENGMDVWESIHEAKYKIHIKHR